jgi:hypothetical protein
MSPDFVPGSMLTPGVELRLSNKEAVQPAPNGSAQSKPVSEPVPEEKQASASETHTSQRIRRETFLDGGFNEFIKAVEPANPNLSGD